MGSGQYMTRVLVIDDEKEVVQFLVEVLSDHGFSVHGVSDVFQISDALMSFNPTIVLLDYRLPNTNGADIVRSIRQTERFQHLPIIMVTGMDGEEEKLRAFELGCDDYVVKPFAPSELAARIRAVLRRTEDRTAVKKSLETDGLVIDLKSHKVLLDGAEVYLTLTEFRILTELVKNDGAVLSRDDLRERALGNLNVTDRTIDVHMASLRKKLPRHGSRIGTVRGVGYRFESMLANQQ
jgi:DNA-binding response OmpR family regulator